MNSDFTAFINRLRGFLFWLPPWASAGLIIALVCVAAIGAHAVALNFLRRSRAGKAAFVKLLLMRAANPTRFAIVLLALVAALPVSGVSSETQHSSRR
jgi:hypothetical protein